MSSAPPPTTPLCRSTTLEPEGGSCVSYVVQLWVFFKGAVVNVFIKFPTPGSAKLQLHGESNQGLYLWYI